MSPPTTRTSAPGTRGATVRIPNTTTSDTTPTMSVAVSSSERPEPRAELLEGVRPGGVGAGELGQLPDHDVDRGAEQEPGHDGTGEELGDPPHPQHGEQQEQESGDEGQPGYERGDVARGGDPGGRHRAGCHGRQAELGPIEICRHVPKMA